MMDGWVDETCPHGDDLGRVRVRVRGVRGVRMEGEGEAQR